MAPHSRTTIYLNVIPGIEETDVSGDISSNVPIVAERSMYRTTPGQYYGLGSNSMGVTAPATITRPAAGDGDAYKSTQPYPRIYALDFNCDYSQTGRESSNILVARASGFAVKSALPSRPTRGARPTKLKPSGVTHEQVSTSLSASASLSCHALRRDAANGSGPTKLAKL
jgi:hypothetical protein